MPAFQVAAPMTPSNIPFRIIIQTGPMIVTPEANVAKETVRLFVVICDAATGFIATTECVHISRRSIVSIICGTQQTMR